MSAENIAELREDILHRETAAAEAAEAACPATRGAAHPGMAELIVTGTFVGVRQHIVCLGRLLEFLFGLLVTRVFIGVVLDGRLAVSLLYFVSVSVFLDAQHFVVIPLFCHGIILLQQLLRNAAPCRPAYNPSGQCRRPCPASPPGSEFGHRLAEVGVELPALDVDLGDPFLAERIGKFL